jgi:hypothetical protein
MRQLIHPWTGSAVFCVALGGQYGESIKETTPVESRRCSVTWVRGDKWQNDTQSTKNSSFRRFNQLPWTWGTEEETHKGCVRISDSEYLPCWIHREREASDKEEVVETSNL